MNASSVEHSRGAESVTVASRPPSLPRPTVVFGVPAAPRSPLSRSRRAAAAQDEPGARLGTPRRQLTTARIRRSIGSATVTVRVHCAESPTGSVQDAVTVNGARSSPTLKACVTPRAYS